MAVSTCSCLDSKAQHVFGGKLSSERAIIDRSIKRQCELDRAVAGAAAAKGVIDENVVKLAEFPQIPP